MSTYQNQIQIVLFDNDKKGNEKAPVMKGIVEFPDGTKYEVAVWERVSKNGNPFKSGILKLMDPNAPQGSYRPANTGGRPAPVQVDF